MNIQNSFKRYEKKFLLTRAQYNAIFPVVAARMTEEIYGQHTICNIYFDTDRYDLIRTSLKKPPYKEKFRLRSYGVPGPDGTVFAEIKKKYAGIVYKRRAEGMPAQLDAFLYNGQPLEHDPQIQQEIRWFLQHYRPLPKAFIGYERIAFFGKDDPEFRVTFDQNIRWRDYDLDLRAGDRGSPLLPEDLIVMEIKIAAAIPLWLVTLLTEQAVRPGSFSKYGTCYQRFLANPHQKGRSIVC